MVTWRVVFFLPLFTVFIARCQTAERAGLVSKHDYEPVRTRLQEEGAAPALAVFPAKEAGAFTTTLEKAWLHFLAGEPDVEALLKISRDLESRQTLFISKEAQKFFLKDAPDGYLPAEHEVIMLHIIAGYSFARLGRLLEARVEAERASRYLQGHYGDFAGSFDDAGLRFLLAGLWLSLDEWQHARVDLRVAGELEPSYAWLKEIAAETLPPQQLVIVMRGVGPEPVWRPGELEAKRWGIAFIFAEDELPVVLSEDHRTTNLNHSVHTASWYSRHLERDSLPRTVLDDVRHGVDTAAGVTGAVIVCAAAGVVAVGLTVGAVAISTGIIALSGATKEADVMAAAMRLSSQLVGGAMALSFDVGSESVDKAHEIYADSANESKYYQFVRFLPSYYYLHVSENTSARVLIHLDGEKPLPVLFEKTNKIGKVSLFFSPQ